MFLKNYAEGKRNLGVGKSCWRGWLTSHIRPVKDYLSLCFEVKQERDDLAKLTETELQDIGIHPADVAAERRRSFFDVPAERLNEARASRKMPPRC